MGMDYRKAGVDIAAAGSFVDSLKELAARTRVKGQLGDIGLFSGLFSLQPLRYRQPVLVSGIDGVGTKILLAEAAGIYDTVGIDLVAMNVNDILTAGARPLFFLDYLAVGRLDRKRELALIKGIVEGCRQAGCALIGGETAQMGDVYGPKGFDLAGCAVGVVEKARIVSGAGIRPGDRLLALPSSGLHSNGFSLVRKLFSPKEIKRDPELARRLLTPTRIYVKTILNLLEKVKVKGMAHSTGGGPVGNIRRVLPDGTRAVLEAGTWEMPALFKEVQARGRVSRLELARTLNLGLGFVLVLSPAEAGRAVRVLRGLREPVLEIGRIEAAPGGPDCVISW